MLESNLSYGLVLQMDYRLKAQTLILMLVLKVFPTHLALFNAPVYNVKEK